MKGYMTLGDLNADQKSQLKQAVLMDRMDAKGKSPSYGELADADKLVSDKDLERTFRGVAFCAGDFT